MGDNAYIRKPILNPKCPDRGQTSELISLLESTIAPNSDESFIDYVETLVESLKQGYEEQAEESYN